MNVTVQPSGALLIDHPSAETVYDLGNERLYACCDAQGRISNASTPEGFPLLTMRSVRYMVLNDTVKIDVHSTETVVRSLADQFKGTNSEGTGKKEKRLWTASESEAIRFDTAEAIGRIWTLRGSHADLTVTVSTFLDNTSPAV